MSDHFQPWRHTGGHAPFSFAWLGALGERTSRAIIGTSVVTPTFRYHPSIVAQAIGTLGSLFPGRVLLGVGTGESLNEVPATGMEWPPFKERFQRLREAIELMRRLAREERVTSRATTIGPPRPRSTTAPRCRCRSTSRPRARSRRGSPAGSATASSAPAARRRSCIARCCCRRSPRACEKSGRDGAGFERMIEMKVSFDTDRARAMEDTRHWAALALSGEEKMAVEDPLEMERLADALPAERAASRWIVSTDPDEHVERLAETIALGFTHLVFHAPGPDQRRFLDLYAQQVLPRLRARYG